jgi:hypothetical protein
MPRKFRFLLLACTSLLLMQFNPQPKKITAKFFPEKTDLPNVTPALKKKKGFTNYPELIGFLEGLVKQFPDRVQLSYIGKSKKGKDIPMILLRSGSGAGKIRIWMQGGLHGDEPASTEAMLYLLHVLLNQQENAALLDQIELAVVPMANIDGYLEQQRNNAEGLDLNRDQTKLMAVESPQLKLAFARFQPHVALDFHEFRPYRRDYVKLGSFGVTALHDVMLLYSGNLNVPEPLRRFTQERFLDPTRALLNSAGLQHHDYVTPEEEDGHMHFNRGSNNARSSATNYALLNSVSTLVEVRGVGIGRTSFKRRIFTGYLIAKSFIDQAIKEKTALLALLENPVPAAETVVTSKRAVYEGQMDFIDIEKAEKISLPVTFRDALQSKATLTRRRPQAYLVESSEEWLIRKLQFFNFRIDTLKASQAVEVEQFYIEKYSSPAERYEQMKLQEVSARIDSATKTFPAGTYRISTSQAHGNLLGELLEPEAPNSFVSFGLLPTESGRYLPVYRQIKP